MAAEDPKGPNAPESEAAAPQEAAPAPPKGLRSWIAAHRFKAIGTAGLLLAIIVAAISFWIWRRPTAPEEPGVTSEMALEALQQGKYAEARELAEALTKQSTLPEEEAGVPAFVLGVAAAREAEKQSGADRRKLYLVAAGHLQDARTRGFPAGHQADGMLLLGQCLYESGQAALCRSVLREALEIEKRRKAEIHFLLAAAYLRDSTAKLNEALQENALGLAEPKLSASERTRGLLQRSEILVAMGRLPECLETLAKIPPKAKGRDEVDVLRSRVVIEEARALKKNTAVPDQAANANQKYQEAIKMLREAQGHETLATPATQKATYLIGVCLMELGDQRGAINQFARTRTIYPGTSEATAAAFYEAELCRQAGRDKEALAGYRRALRSVTDPETYDNPWLRLDEMRRRTIGACQQYLDAKNYTACLDLARLLTPAFPKERAIQTVAETYRAWGHDLLTQAEQLPLQKAEVQAREGRQHLRKAGKAYEDLARLRVITREYPKDLWASATSYLEGRYYRGAAAMFREYLKNEARTNQAPALAGLGESLLALDRVDEAIAAFRTCVALYPRDVSTFRARILASRAYLERGDFKQAEAFLEGNINGEVLTPASKEWRESLFVLGELLHRSGRYEEAIRRLEEAVKRYGDSRQALSARYLIADCYRQNARAEAAKLEKDLVEEARVTRAKRIHDSLSASLEQYRQAQEGLLRFQEGHDLGPLEKAMLRNCYFNIGSLHFELGQYDAAVKAYGMAANRYQSSPEVLDAYVQMARAYRQLNRPTEARATLEQAKVVLNRMKPQVAFQATTNHSREEWVELLDRLSKQN